MKTLPSRTIRPHRHGRSVRFNPRTQTVHITLDSENPYTNHALLRISQLAALSGIGRFQPTDHFAKSRGAYNIPLHNSPTQITLKAAPPGPAARTHASTR